MTDPNVIEAVRKLATGVSLLASACGADAGRKAAELADEAAAMLAAEKPAAPDPHDFVIACLRNSGVDTTCGACVEVAFSGATTASHTCEKKPADVQSLSPERQFRNYVSLLHEVGGRYLRDKPTDMDAWLQKVFPGVVPTELLLQHLRAVTLRLAATEKSAEKPAAPALPWVVRRKGGGRVIAQCEDQGLASSVLGLLAHADLFEVAPAAPAIVPVRFDAAGDAINPQNGAEASRGADGWEASCVGKSLIVHIALRPGEDAGDLTARIVAAVGRGP